MTKSEKSRQINALAIEWVKEFSPYGMFTTDTDLKVIDWNRWMAVHSERKPEAVLGLGLLDLYADLVERKMDRYFRQALSGQTAILSHRFHGYLIPMKPGPEGDGSKHMPQSATISPLHSGEGVVGIIVYIDDVGEQIRREKELEKRISDLEAALKEVKTLKGLLPICSYCKSIRDDKGYWSKLESYFGEHAEVDFSHGICPECAEKHFPEMDLYGKDD